MQTNETKMEIVLFVALTALVILIGSSPYTKSVIAGLYDTNDTAVSEVNVTNDPPHVIDMVLYSNMSNVDIDLYPGIYTTVYCNGTITDRNGWQDVNLTNATIFHSTRDEFSPDNQSAKYTNTSCRLYGGSGLSVYSSCSFVLPYFALNGTWTCNMSARDQTVAGSFAATSNTTTRNISKLIALNVTEVIDFGQLTTGENSTSDVLANVTNLGNIRIDLNLHGYARNDGDNYAMVCELGNISIGQVKYNLTSQGDGYDNMTQLSGAVAGVTDDAFNLLSTINSTVPALRNTFWKIGIPTGTRGICNGTIVFDAVEG
jgi:hypothetical protein